MEFSIRDFAPIKEADIKLDGLTVIAGDNDTGKSTVGKLLYSMTKAYRQRHVIDAKDDQKQSGHAGYLAQLYITLMLGKRELKGSVELRDFFSLYMDGDGFNPILHSDERYLDPLLIESPLVWQLFDTFQWIAAKQSQALELGESIGINYPHSFFDVYSRLNGSVPKVHKLPGLLREIRQTINGQVVFDNNVPVFQRGDDQYSIRGVATGIQAFGLMQRLIEVGLAGPNRLLILDEPEVHLHPKWQLEYARLLVDMVDQLGLTVLLTTHSPVFVEAIEMIGRNKLKERCSIYLSERRDDGVVMKDVTNDLEQIYKSLAQPLARLSLFQEDA